ncbi:MAG: hypothetical protein COB49_01390 [Alphaproteobacteria bacterium]|nr:MAG: hypothetical protein COB49_01390 [Alphaproteobacteria bacterium]
MTIIGMKYVKRRLHYLPFLLLIYLTPLVNANEPLKATGKVYWTEKKLGKIILKADKAAMRKKWNRAIRYGEEMLLGSHALDHHNDHRYINLLKNLNKYYDNAGRIQEIPGRIEKAYISSRKYLGVAHNTTIESRNLYYKIIIFNKDYQRAIPLILENISILGKSVEDRYRLSQYYRQLYSLYGLTRQLEKEEETLLKLLTLDRQLYGYDDQNNAKIILSLAKNYCLQKKLDAFEKIVQTYNLLYFCQ